MASFKQHINISVIATGILIIPLHSSHILDTNQSIIALFMGLIGGMLPDIDLDYSTPTKLFFGLISIFLPFIILLHIKLSPIYIMALWFASTVALKFIFFDTFTALTVHRGIFHTIPMAIFFALISNIISIEVFHLSHTFSLLIGFFIFWGFIIHLLLDEIYSIDFSGLKIKRSFGTALKLFDLKNKIGSIVLYLLVLGLLYLYPLDKTLILKIFHTFKFF